MQKKNIFFILTAVLMTLFLSAGTSVLAANAKKTAGISGRVSAISGTTITLSVGGISGAFSVDASKSKITKGVQTINLSDVKVGDLILVAGTILVVADSITVNTSPSINSNAPVFPGKVTAINGNNFTIQKNGTGINANNPAVLYTINTTSATVFKNQGKDATVSDIAVGKMAVVFGVLDSKTNIISATNVEIITTVSQKPADNATKNQANAKQGILSRVKNFFGNIFK